MRSVLISLLACMFWGCVDQAAERPQDKTREGGVDVASEFRAKHAGAFEFCEAKLDYTVGYEELFGCALARSSFDLGFYTLLTTPTVERHKDVWDEPEFRSVLSEKYGIEFSSHLERWKPHGEPLTDEDGRKAYQDVMIKLLQEKWGADFLSSEATRLRRTDCRWPDRPGGVTAGDTLSEKQIGDSVAANYQGVQACYSKQGQTEKESLRIDAKVTIKQDGRVSDVELSGAQDDKNLRLCLATAIKAWKFPEAEAETRTSIPFVFRGDS